MWRRRIFWYLNFDSNDDDGYDRINSKRPLIDGGYTVHTVIREWEDTQQSTGGATQQIYCWILQSILQSIRKCGCVEYEYEDMQVDGWQDIIKLMIGWQRVARERRLYIYPTINHDGKTQQLIGYCNSWECGCRINICADRWSKKITILLTYVLPSIQCLR